MRLVKFRIQNYKRIEETDWIEVDDVTALVGGNETGKTSVLQALWKLKPGRENIVLNAQDEFPRRRYITDYLQGGLWPVVSAVFDIDPELHDQLVELDAAFRKCKQVEVTSYYDHDPTVVFLPDVALPAPSADDVGKLLKHVAKLVEKVKTSTDVSEEDVQNYRADVLKLVERTQEEMAAEGGVRLNIRGVLGPFRDQMLALSTEDWQKALWAEMADELEALLARPHAEERFQQAVDLVWQAMPVLIYFDDYNLLESEVYIPEALQRMAAGSTDPKVRSQWALFERAGFPIREISGLAFRPDPHQPIDDDSLDKLFEQIRERAIIASAAGRTITEELSDYWHQHRHEIEFRVDGETFQIWVADDKYPTLIEFEGRSKGFRWFFTFYLVFTVETGHAHKNAVLLLDEPGLHLYPPAQEELLKLFDELSLHNQIIYTTHSPFMVDNRHLERVRVVEEKDDGLVRISNDVSSGLDAVYPVRANLGFRLAQTTFLAQRVLLVESEADYRLLVYLSHHLNVLGRQGLPDGMAITFAGGAASIQPLLAMMLPTGFEVVVLLNGDSSGRATAKALEKQGLSGLPNVAVRSYTEVMDAPDAVSLLPPDLYRRAVELSHDVELPEKIKGAEKQTLSAAIAAFFESESIRFDAPQTIQWLIDRWSEEEPVPANVLDGLESVFRAVEEAVHSISGAE